MAEITQLYHTDTAWDTDKLGFDFSKIHHYYIKSDILHVQFIKGGDYSKYPPTEGPDCFYEHPDHFYDEIEENPIYSISCWETKDSEEKKMAIEKVFNNVSEVIAEAKELNKIYDYVIVYDKDNDEIFKRSLDVNDCFGFETMNKPYNKQGKFKNIDEAIKFFVGISLDVQHTIIKETLERIGWESTISIPLLEFSSSNQKTFDIDIETVYKDSIEKSRGHHANSRLQFLVDKYCEYYHMYLLPYIIDGVIRIDGYLTPLIQHPRINENLFRVELFFYLENHLINRLEKDYPEELV